MVALLCVMLDAMHEVFPAGNARLVIVINEAHTTGTGVIWALKGLKPSRRKSHICLSCHTWSM